MTPPPCKMGLVKFPSSSKPCPVLKISSRYSLIYTLMIALACSARAQDRPIQDNSFLMEEAYNQEAGIVQHISLFTHSWDSHSWTYTFTQEWPLPVRPRHQLSYSLAVMDSGAFPSAGGGLGDFLLNYRYQLIGGGDSRVAFSPRLSLSLPSGDSKLGRGFGAPAVQANLPFSLVLGQQWVMHLNAGTTIAPRAQNEIGDRALVAGYNLGQSFIWLARARFNILLETVWNDSASVVGPSRTERSRDLLLTPGFRWAYNFRNGLQIVPGLGMSIGVGPSAGEKGLVVYLSFEHPFTKARNK